MNKKMSALCAALSLLVLFSGCKPQESSETPEVSPLPTENAEEPSAPVPTEDAAGSYALSIQFTEYLSKGETGEAMAMMDEAMIDAMDGKLEDIWTQLSDAGGNFTGTGAHTETTSGEYEVVEMTLVFERASFIQRTVFDSDGRLSGLFFRNGEIEAPTEDAAMPEGVTETAVTVDAGEGYPLDGMLTMPADGEPVAAVVLVHGSGPSDMNETIGANAPFRDLAYSLAEKGIAVLRYDKRTYAHGAAMVENGASVTIDEEVTSDALAAVELIKSCEGIDAQSVYLLGHSMGGGLLAHINSMGADCAGYIILGGTPRNIWELSAEQNLLIADELEQSGNLDDAEEIRDFVEQESLRAANLTEMDGGETLFGMPVSYLQEMDQIDAAALHLSDGLPVLILQGGKDRQVTMKDFDLWQEELANHPDAEFYSYPTLNHLFGEYTGDFVPFSQMPSVEYAQRTPVSDDLINDIAEWFAENRD